LQHFINVPSFVKSIEMKKLMVFFAFCLNAGLLYAQQNREQTEFTAYSQAIETNAHTSYKNKEYTKSVDYLDEWFSRYEQLSPDMKKKFRVYIPGTYYNLACYKAMAGRKPEAIAAFTKAVDAGYKNYASTLTDTDLETLRNDKQFKADLQRMREAGDVGYILKKSGPYSDSGENLPAFTYQSPSAPELVALKNKFDLDSISGNGDEISKFKKLLYWVHNSVRHDGTSNNPPSKNAVDLIGICKKENRGVNCRMMATILRDVYQAEGYNTRIVTCMPKDTADFDCHVITVVWSKTLNKWVWMDPTFNAYVSDEKGNLLNIEEVRERLISGSPLVLNDDANWNNKQKETKEYYLGYYMSKNLYWLKCSIKSEWDIETRTAGKPAIDYINLYPGNFNTIHQSKKVWPNETDYATNSVEYFWQKPAGQ
jgi:hypothetical protein